MSWVRSHPAVFGLIFAFYLTANLGLSSTAIQAWLFSVTNGMEIPECGCLDPNCQCGAPCCSPEAKRLRAARDAGADQETLRALAEESCCDTPQAAGGHSCCEKNDYEELILRTACTCSSGRIHLGIIAGDNHVFPSLITLPLPTPSTPAPTPQPPALVWATTDPPDKIPKA